MPNDQRPAAPHHPARRGGRDRQEHVRLRVRRRDRRHRLRADVPRRGDVRDRPRHPRHQLPQGTPRQGQGVPHHPRPRGPRRRLCRTCCPSSRACRSTPRRWPAASSATRSRSTSSPTTRCSALDPGDEIDIGAFHVDAVPGRPLDPGRDGHRPADAGRDDRPHRRLQVRPHARRRQAVGLRDPRQARRRRASPACCPTRPVPRTPATRRPSGRSARPSARSWSRSTAGSSSPRSRATSPGSSRSSTPPRTWAATSRSSAARWSRTSGSRPTSAT